MDGEAKNGFPEGPPHPQSHKMENNAECPICYMPMTMHVKDPSTTVMTACKHAFHTSCIMEWMYRSSGSSGSSNDSVPCPMCRSDIFYNTDIKVESSNADADALMVYVTTHKLTLDSIILSLKNAPRGLLKNEAKIDLSRVERLKIVWDNDEAGDIHFESVTAFPNLVHLCIYGCAITSLEPLRSMRRLKSLAMDFDCDPPHGQRKKLSLEPIAGHNIGKLYCHGSLVDTSILERVNWPLEELVLTGASNIAFVERFRTTLKTLQLSKCIAPDFGALQTLQVIERLHVTSPASPRNAALAAMSLAPLMGIKTLTWIYIRRRPDAVKLTRDASGSWSIKLGRKR